MNSPCRHLLVSLSCAALMFSCSPQEKGHATPEAAAELALISSYLPEIGIDEVLEIPGSEEIYTLLSDFATSADPRQASRPSGVNMLHLACLFKKPELARCLLIDHADPNAATVAGDTPLGLAVSLRGTEDDAVTDESIIKLIDILVAGGADINRHTADDMPLLNYAGLNCYSEKVFLHLLDIGCPHDETTSQAPAMMGWNTALKRMLDLGAGKNPASMEAMLLMAAANLHADTVQLLIEAGADVNAHQLSGTTPLVEAAGHLLSPAEEEENARREAIIDVCARLIQHGADPFLTEIRQDGSPAFCAADILGRDADIVAALQARGIQIQAQEIKFTSGIELLEAIGKATVLERQPAAADFDAIATVLTPDEEMRKNPRYHEVLPMAVELLHGLDPARASQAITAMPIWTSKEAWEQGHGEALLPALTNCSGIVLPREIICATASRLDKEGQADNAAYMIELLARCPDAQAEIDRFCTHESRPLKAGALAARLLKAGLPTPRDGDVQLWLDNHKREADKPELAKAVLLTSLSRLWYGDMLPAEQEQMLAAMEEIGATEAAGHYRAIAAAMDDPEALDKLTENSDSWKFELEIATAEYILRHSAVFLPAAAEIAD